MGREERFSRKWVFVPDYSLCASSPPSTVRPMPSCPPTPPHPTRSSALFSRMAWGCCAQRALLPSPGLHRERRNKQGSGSRLPADCVHCLNALGLVGGGSGCVALDWRWGSLCRGPSSSVFVWQGLCCSGGPSTAFCFVWVGGSSGTRSTGLPSWATQAAAPQQGLEPRQADELQPPSWAGTSPAATSRSRAVSL